MKKVQINGNSFSSLKEFYDEIERKLTKNLDWKIGRNLNAFDDVLFGGFGIHDFKEEIELNWLNSNKSKSDLGMEETIKYIQVQLKNCHPTNRRNVDNDLKLAMNGKGNTLFEIIVRIIREHQHIKLELN